MHGNRMYPAKVILSTGDEVIVQDPSNSRGNVYVSFEETVTVKELCASKMLKGGGPILSTIAAIAGQTALNKYISGSFMPETNAGKLSLFYTALGGAYQTYANRKKRNQQQQRMQEAEKEMGLDKPNVVTPGSYDYDAQRIQMLRQRYQMKDPVATGEGKLVSAKQYKISPPQPDVKALYRVEYFLTTTRKNRIPVSLQSACSMQADTIIVRKTSYLMNVESFGVVIDPHEQSDFALIKFPYSKKRKVAQLRTSDLIPIPKDSKIKVTYTIEGQEYQLLSSYFDVAAQTLG